MNSFNAFILAHEDFAESLKSTAEKITGSQPNIFFYSNKIDSLQIIFKKINEQIETLQSNRIYVFVDLIGGSCWSLANMIAKENPDKEVVFFAVGFETTAPGNAMAVYQAKKQNILNF